VLTFPLQVALMADREFPLALTGMVHVENTNTLRRHVDVGETLTLAVHAEALRPHPKGALVDLVGRVDVTAADVDVAAAETVWTGRSTYLSPGAEAPTGAGEDPEWSQMVRHAGVSHPLRPVPDRPVSTWRVGDDVGRRYASVSGDINPIHLNPLAAKAFGFPRAIAHGMWTYARTLAWLGARAPARHTSTVEFSRPVLLPSTVNVHAMHGTERESGTEWTVELRPGGSKAGSTGRDGAPTRHLRATVRPL
jgi:acyl dehydratase